jgi:DNA-binding transcriptional LysR family regulator
MKDLADWDALRLFLVVARAGGLGAAARRTGVSAPTLGRRMTALERQLNLRLFDRRQTGYELTEAGRELYEQAREMEAVAAGIDRRQAPRRVVRISAGAWTCRFLALHVARLWQPDEPMAVEFLTAAARLDIVRRQADIGVRNRAPEEARLSGRRVNDVAHAIYRSRGAPPVDPATAPWIGVVGDAGVTPSARWVAARYLDRVVMSCSDPRLVVELLRAGVGVAVLPCFVGDGEPELVRAGDTIDELREQQWRVLNQSERHQPAVRTVIDRTVALLKEHRDLFRGALAAG